MKYISGFILLCVLSVFSQAEQTSYGLENPDGTIARPASADKVQSDIAKRTSEKTNGQIVILKSVYPKYPKKALKEEIEGDVVIDFIVNEKGKVTDITIFRSAGQLLDKASIDAIKQWRFQPILKDGVPTKTKMRQKFPFKISG